jgi:nitrate reductase NapE component
LKKNEKKRKKEKVSKKKKEKRKALWITVVIHSVLCVGEQ